MYFTRPTDGTGKHPSVRRAADYYDGNEFLPPGRTSRREYRKRIKFARDTQSSRAYVRMREGDDDDHVLSRIGINLKEIRLPDKGDDEIVRGAVRLD